MKKTSRAILTVLLCLSICLPLAVKSNAAEKVTLDRAVAISDTQIILEFSEPVAFNYNDSNTGPFTAIRLVDGTDTLLWKGDTPMQATGFMTFVDSKHDRVLWTITEMLGGNATVTDILGFKGDLSGYKSGNSIKFCIEEIPYDNAVGIGDGLLDNVTNADGTVNLTASRPIGRDGVYVPIETDFDYEVDITATESISSEQKSEDNFKISVTTYDPAAAEAAEKAGQPNMILIIGLLAGSVILVAAIFVCIVFRTRKKGNR